MSEIKRHLYYRFRYSGFATLCISIIFMMNLFVGNVSFISSYSRIQLEQFTFESIYNLRNLNILPYFVILVMIVNIFILYRNYSRTKERWLLMPQSRMSIVYADCIWILCTLLVLYIIQFVVYWGMFHNYVNAMNEAGIVNFAQTRNLLTSISRSSIAVCYPTNILGIVKICLLGLWSTLTVCLISALLLIERYKRWHIWILAILCIALVYAFSFSIIDSVVCIVLLVTIVSFIKIITDCWNHQIGG